MKTRKKFLSVLSCALAAVLTFGIAGCGSESDSDSGSGSGSGGSTFTPVDTEHYNYNRFDDDANFEVAGVDDSEWDGVKADAVTDGYEKGNSRAPQTSTYLGTVTPVKPLEGVYDEHEKYGVDQYPSYGKNLGSLPEAKFNAIIKECRDLIPGNTWHSTKSYYYIDSEGYLLDDTGARIPYKNDSGDSTAGSENTSPQFNEQYRMLYKHTSAATMYGGGLTDDEPRIVKELTYITRTSAAAKQITGLYAPAGEVIKFEMSEADFTTANGVQVYIGQNYNIDGQDGVSLEYNTSDAGITTAKGSGFNRMPNILSHFGFAVNAASPVVTHENGVVTFYVGSFWGGPIYMRPNANGAARNISVKISGGVRYQHFILGATTKEEYDLDAASTAPYFDLEIYDSAIRFTTGIAGAERLKTMSYQDCTDAAILWDKITQVSRRVNKNGLTSTVAPINFIGDCYIAAGAAYANPGRNGVVCPPGWVSSALNYSSFVNGGDWGSMHEFNHCWQGYGVANNGEVTNNATTLVSYSLYTRISASRTAAVGWGNGGWNRFTDPSKALGEILTQSTTAANNSSKCYDLPLYATLIHNIGQDSFIKAAQGGSYFDNLVNASHYDMTYYFRDILHFDIGDEYDYRGTLSKSVIDEVKEKDYPMFVPVSSVYQVGRSIIYDNEKQYITTAQPFSYGSGEFVMDFNNHNNFKENSFTSKNLVIPDGFSVEVVSVTQPENGSVELLDNNYVKYTPKSSADGLYSGNFRVKLRITKDDGEFIVEDVDLVINLKQSVSTNLTRTTYIYDSETDVPDPSSVYNAETKTFNFGSYAETETIKNVCTQETNANTQIWGAGRNYYDDVFNANTTNYRELPLKQTLQTMDGAMYFSGEGTYRFTLKGRGKATLYLSYDNGVTWESALTIERDKGTDYIATEYSEHEFTTTQNYVCYKVVLLVKNNWQDFFGIGVSKEDQEGTFPAFTNAINTITINTVEIDKATKEESAKKFETPYYYTNEYKYTYANTTTYNVGTLVSVSHDSWANADRGIENLFDGNTDTFYHSLAGEANYITAAKPLELVADLGAVCKINSVTFNGYTNSIGNNGMVKSFQIWGSLDSVDYFLVTEQSDSAANAKNMTFNFDAVEMRYYKLVVTKTDNGRYFAMARILFQYVVNYSNGNQISPNNFFVRYIGDSWTTKNALCNFGLAYIADAGDSVEFRFTGTRFAYFAYQSSEYGKVDIYVDGQRVAEDVDLSANKNVGSLAYMYLDDALDNSKEHIVKVVGKSGKFNVDSFVYWN